MNLQKSKWTVDELMQFFRAARLDNDPTNNCLSNLLTAVAPAAEPLIKTHLGDVLLIPTIDFIRERVRKQDKGDSAALNGRLFHFGSYPTPAQAEARQQELISTGDWKLDTK